MNTEIVKRIVVERGVIHSHFLAREVIIDYYHPPHLNAATPLHLLLINDGQDLVSMGFENLLGEVAEEGRIQPMLCVGIHANADRRAEYGTAGVPDFGGRGAKAGAFHSFILEELLPHINNKFAAHSFQSHSVAGFSLGGLTAIDLAWRHPKIFSVAGVFSGSLWWRSKDLGDGYVEETDRIMHALVRAGKYSAGLRFYFTTGSLDETADRNNNGIIDSIDDTLGMIEELKKKGYEEDDIRYVNYEDGRHDVATWQRALPDFLRWGWGLDHEKRIIPESC
jgi:enterochelin esterase-like enzyme